MSSKVDYVVISAVYSNPEHTQVRVVLQDSDKNEFTYFFIPGLDDEAPISVYLESLYKKGELKITIDKEYDDALLSSDILMKRDTLLKESDHYMIDDYPISKEKKEEMKAYRQSLRNITKQKSFPDNIVWPKKPEVDE